MKTFFVKVVIGVVLGWITSVLERIKRDQQKKEEGKKEVKDALDKKQTEVAKEVEIIRNTDTSFDTAIDELRKRSNRS